MLRLIPLIFVLFLTPACSLPKTANPPAALGESREGYRSQVVLPEAGTFFHFSRGQLLAADGDYAGALKAFSLAAASDPESSFLQLALARTYLEAGRDAEGIAAAEEALRLDPASSDAEMLLGNIHFQRGEDQEAITYFKRVLERNPADEGAYLHLGITYARSGNYEKAAETLERAFEKSPEAIGIAMTLARLYREMDRDSLAQDIYRQLIDRHPGFGQPFIELGMLLEKYEKVDPAIESYRQALTLEEDAGLRHRIARLLIIRNRFEEALGELQTILAAAPYDLDALRKIGLIYLEQQKWREAQDAFTTILDQRAELEPIRFYLGIVLERQEKWSEALTVFQSISPEAESYSDTLAHISYLLHRLDRKEEAIGLLEEHGRKDSLRPELFSYLASLYEGEKDYAAALATVARGLTVYPDNIGLLYQRGVMFERQGARSAAIDAMHRVLEADPDHVEALNYIAYSHAEAGESLLEALQMAQRAVELKAEGHIHDTLGWVYFKLGRLPEARQQAEIAVTLLPADPLVREHLGDIYRAMKEKEKTRATYRKALELDPQGESVRKKLEGLR